MKLSAEWVRRKSKPVPHELIQSYGSLLATVLWSRGFEDQESANTFLNPRLDELSSPFLLLSMLESAEHVARAIVERHPIAVYADYDMDGMSGLALLVSFFQACGAGDVLHYQPDRFEEGYGVHPKAIEELVAKGVKTIISVDTGISAFEAAKVAKALNVSLVITDHHKQISAEVPDTPFVINPNQTLDTSGLGYLSGVGVAFYLAIAVRHSLRKQGYFRDQLVEPDLRQWLDLFVLGTLADHVDLVGDNRILVRTGLLQLKETQRAGLAELVSRTLFSVSQITARDVVFSLTPKLNAASRMGKAHFSTELLLCDDRARARELCEELLMLNDQRSQIQQQVFSEAFVQAQSQIDNDPENPVLVVHGEWHEGVLGVVAAKLVEKFRKPSIVLTKIRDGNYLRGSMRTMAPISCVKALDACKDFLDRYGGHTMAAGLQLSSKHFENFFSKLRESSKEFVDSITHVETIEYDDELPLSRLSIEDIEGLYLLSPWGSGNPEPLFKLSNIDSKGFQVIKGQHLKYQLQQDITLMGFFKSADFEYLTSLKHRQFDVLVSPEINTFRGKKSIQLKIHSMRPTDLGCAESADTLNFQSL